MYVKHHQQQNGIGCVSGIDRLEMKLNTFYSILLCLLIKKYLKMLFSLRFWMAHNPRTWEWYKSMQISNQWRILFYRLFSILGSWALHVRLLSFLYVVSPITLSRADPGIWKESRSPSRTGISVVCLKLVCIVSFECLMFSGKLSWKLGSPHFLSPKAAVKLIAECFKKAGHNKP